MSNRELRDQFARCLEWQDADQWDALAMCFFAAGFVLNAGYCWQRADILRGCSFSEAMTARAQPLAGVEVEE
jgi:hypothetical protein